MFPEDFVERLEHLKHATDLTWNGFADALEVADYFGVPEEFVRLQAPMVFRLRADETVR